MGAITVPQGARSSALTVTGLSTLASATYCVSEAINNATNDPQDTVIEVEITTTNTPTGAKQVLVFAKASLDGTNYQSGPESGTTATDEEDLTPLGYVPVRAAGTHRRFFSVSAAYDFNPAYFKIVLKNDLGVALTGGNVYKVEITGNVA